MFSLTIIVLHASLILFGCLLLQIKDGEARNPGDDLSGPNEIVKTLKQGREAVKVLVKDSGRLIRIRVTLDKILQTAETFVAMLRRRGSDDQTSHTADEAITQGNSMDEADLPAGQPASREVLPVSMQEEILGQDVTMDWQAMFSDGMDVFPILNLNGSAFNLNEFITM